MASTALADIASPNGLVGGPFGSDLVGADYVDYGVPVIRGGNLGERYLAGDFAFVSESKFRRDLNRNSAVPGDLIFTQRGTLGQVSLVQDGSFPIYVVSQSQMRLRTDPDRAIPKYVYYACSTAAFKRQLMENAIATGVPHVNLGILSRLVIPMVELRLQRSICEVLGALDDKIAANEHTVAVMDDLSFALVRAGNQTPEARLAQVGQVMSLKYGKALPAASRRDGTVTVFGSGGPVGVHDRALVNGPGVVIGRKGTVGAVYWADGPHYPIDTTYYVEPLEGLAPEILYYALRDVRLADLNSDSAVPGLNRDEACTQIVCLPGPGDHERITADVRHNFDAARAIRAESQCLRGTRDELLPLLMSGRLRVKDAEKVVAEVV